MEIVPFLFQFAVPTTSPSRCTEPDDRYEYDEQLDIMMFVGGGNRTPAITSTFANGPRTKKADMEKGEDTKDGRMWR